LFIDAARKFIGSAAESSPVVLAVAYNKVNAYSLQQKEEQQIKIAPYEKKNITHRVKII
jgi:hypothetical protein